MLDKPLDDKLNQLLNQVRELDTNSKSHELKLVEKDKEIENQSKQVESLVKQMEDQEINHNKQIENLVNRMEDQERKNVNHNKQMKNLVKQMEDQSKQIDNLVKEVRSPHKCQNNMIMQNIEDETNFYPICTTFQWKFKPTEIIPGSLKYSPPFYNAINPHCFQLGVYFLENEFRFVLFRYRGKYDHHSNAINVTKDINFEIRIFGKNGKLKVLDSYVGDYSVVNYQVKSKGIYNKIDHREIGSLTTDNGYVTLQCFFNKTT